mgnify:CR=1 FL=1
MCCATEFELHHYEAYGTLHLELELHHCEAYGTLTPTPPGRPTRFMEDTA